jgi:hypothetical protein
MRPAFPVYDSHDLTLGNSMDSSKVTEGHLAGCVRASNVDYIPVATDGLMILPATQAAPTTDHVSHVVRLGSDDEVRWVATHPDVARVSDHAA